MFDQQLHLTSQDDLKIVEGIGPKMKAFQEASIFTFSDLSKTRNFLYKDILERAGSHI
jgi:predicted flap endonuclease-1-like 5' DNA nuclease